MIGYLNVSLFVIADFVWQDHRRCWFCFSSDTIPWCKKSIQSSNFLSSSISASKLQSNGIDTPRKPDAMCFWLTIISIRNRYCENIPKDAEWILKSVVCHLGDDAKSGHYKHTHVFQSTAHRHLCGCISMIWKIRALPRFSKILVSTAGCTDLLSPWMCLWGCSRVCEAYMLARGCIR